MIKVIMLSGGLESTGYLYQQLKETNNKIHIHHVKLKNRENRDKAEDKVIKEIVEDARKIRDFVFSTTTYECPDCLGIGYTGFDIIKIGFIGGDIACAIQKAIMMNYSWEDIEVNICSSLSEIESEDKFKLDTRYKGANAAFQSHFLEYQYNDVEKPKLNFPLLNIKTSDIIKYIPINIKTISCRRPVYVGDEYIACGLCHSCKKVRGIYDSK